MNDHVYKNIEVIGSSDKGIQEAIEKAISRVAATVRNMRWFELVNVRGHLNDGKVEHWQVTIKIGFDVENT